MVQLATIGNSATKTVGNNRAIGVAFLEALTLVRVRGTGFIFMDPGAIGEIILVGVGLIIVKADAFAIGATAVPGPITDLDADWLWHRIVPLGPTAQAAQAGNLVPQVERFEIDSKAQRKVKPNDSLVFVAEGDVSAGAPTYDAHLGCRHLLMLS